MKVFFAALILLTPAALAAKSGVEPGTFRSVGKQVAPVEVVQARRYEASVGQRVPLALNLRLLQPADRVSVQISADPGLGLEQRVVRHELGAHAAGPLSLPPVDVTVLDEGRHHVNVTVFMRGAWGERFRSFSVSLDTPDGAKAPRKRSDLKADATGQVLRVMPAVQTD